MNEREAFILGQYEASFPAQFLGGCIVVGLGIAVVVTRWVRRGFRWPNSTDTQTQSTKAE